jgi:hypothetical protein
MSIRLGPKVNKIFGFAEHLAIYLCAMHRDEGDALLEGLAHKKSAASLFHQLVQGDSASRQAALTKEFGIRVDAKERIHALVVQAPAALRSQIVKSLPANLRGHFPHLEREDTEASPALVALAQRLVRETMRL